MHLFALDEKRELVSAKEAIKGQDYRCLECLSKVRLRSGESVQEHFWHLQPRVECRQSAKSAAHLQIQLRLHKLLPPHESLLECRFPARGRIADVAWVDEKIIFEVQVSPITKEEVKARNSDYASLGWQVVWILHEKQFGKRGVTAAENYLQDHPHYFCNINGSGQGEIFDRLDHMEKGRRYLIKKEPFVPLIPLRLKKKGGPRALWPLHFEGDLTEESDSKRKKRGAPLIFPSYLRKLTSVLRPQ